MVSTLAYAALVCAGAAIGAVVRATAAGLSSSADSHEGLAR
jgi:hypothetical protein